MSTPASDSFTAKLSLLTLPEPLPSEAWSASELANMDMLEGTDLPECILKATIQGRERTVRKIKERRGPVPILFEVNPDDPFDQKPMASALRSTTRNLLARRGVPQRSRHC
jgi:hypothetical protein